MLCIIAVKHSDNSTLLTYLEDNHTSSSFFVYNPNGSSADTNPLTLKGGMDLLITGAIQGLMSYPFFDPVLTDRTFLAHPRTMARSITFGGLIAGSFIVLFSIIGVYGSMLGRCVDAGVCPVSDLNGASLSSVKGGVPAEVAKTIGTGVFNLLFIVMSTSSISTLDSTFASTAKLCGPGELQRVAKHRAKKSCLWHTVFKALNIISRAPSLYSSQISPASSRTVSPPLSALPLRTT